MKSAKTPGIGDNMKFEITVLVFGVCMFALWIAWLFLH